MGSDKTIVPSNLSSGVSERFGPKAACLNSNGSVPVGDITSRLFLLVEKTGSSLNLPPTKTLDHVTPPSLDFQRPLPKASPLVYISPVPT